MIKLIVPGKIKRLIKTKIDNHIGDADKMVELQRENYDLQKENCILGYALMGNKYKPLPEREKGMTDVEYRKLVLKRQKEVFGDN